MAAPLRLVFAGTPEFAVPCLQAAVAAGDVVAVYTQPDRPAGRGRHLQPSPVKRAAQDHGIEVRQPQSLRTAEAKAALRELAPDLMVVVAYGLILPQSVLDIPRHGCWNVHASLLPRWRGAAPIQRAIEAGDAMSGVCLMQMERGLDTGPVLLRRELQLAAEETGGSLHERLAALGARVLSEGLAGLGAGETLPAQPQSGHGVTYAHKLEKQEARLDWTQPAQVLAQRVRAFNPWPVAEAQLAGERVRIHAAEAVVGQPGAAAGSILHASRDGIVVACGQGALKLVQVQREGGRPMAAADYLNARPQLRPA